MAHRVETEPLARRLAGSVSVTIDVAGYYRSGSGTSFVPLTPVRVLDTRPTTTIGGYSTPFGPGTSRAAQLRGRGGVPTGALAVTGNLVTQNTTAASQLVAWPAGTSRPVATSAMFPTSAANAGAVTMRPASSGSVAVHNQTGSTDLMVDVTGCFT